MANENSKKVLFEKLKAKLNSPEYVKIPDLLKINDYYPDIKKSADRDCITSLKDWNFGEMEMSGESKFIIFSRELEPKDWEEIINLVEKRNKERDQIYNEKRGNIDAKLNSNSNLYYYWGQGSKLYRANVWIEPRGMRGYVTFSGKNNNRGYGLYIVENHPILDNFSFETGFYLIDTNKPIERNSPCYWNSGEGSDPSNFTRYVELGDNITITPYDEMNSLLQFFKVQNIKKITLTDQGDLVIDNNNNQLVVSSEEVTNNSELIMVKNFLQKNGKTILNQQELNTLLNTNFIQWPSSNNLGRNLAILGFLLLTIILFIYLVVKNKKTKKQQSKIS